MFLHKKNGSLHVKSVNCSAHALITYRVPLELSAFILLVMEHTSAPGSVIGYRVCLRRGSGVREGLDVFPHTAVKEFLDS